MEHCRDVKNVFFSFFTSLQCSMQTMFFFHSSVNGYVKYALDLFTILSVFVGWSGDLMTNE